MRGSKDNMAICCTWKGENFANRKPKKKKNKRIDQAKHYLDWYMNQTSPPLITLWTKKNVTKWQLQRQYSSIVIEKLSRPLPSAKIYKGVAWKVEAAKSEVLP